MPVQRITQNLNFNSRENIIIYYGNIDDQFCSNDLVYANIEQMIWKYFFNQGYKRIIFSNGLKNLYFLDKESLSLCLAKEIKEISQENSELTEGPLGNLMLLDKIEINLDTNTSQQNKFFNIDLSKDKNKDDDIALLQLLNSAILEAIPTIIIIKNIESISEKNYTKETLNYFFNLMEEFTLIYSNLNNKCVILFNEFEINKIVEVIEINKLSFLNEFISLNKYSHENIIKINYPNSSEINNLINHFRILYKLKVYYLLLEKICEFLESQEIPLKRLYRKLKSIKENEVLDKNILLKWYREGFFEKTSEFLINNIGKQFSIRKLLQDNFKKIYSKDENINILIDKLELWFSLKNKKNILSLFFLGNIGTGKKYTIKCMSKALKSLAYDFYSFNMSDYKEYDNIIDLFKSNFEKKKISLFEKLKKKNKLIILFNDIDLSHQNILNSIVYIINRGFLISDDYELKFTDCIFCFSVNKNVENLFIEEFFSSKNKLDHIEFQNFIKSILIENKIIPELSKKIDLFLIYNKLPIFALVQILEDKIKQIAFEYNIEIVSISSEFLVDMIKITDTLGTNNLYNYLLEKIGNLLINYNKDFPDNNKAILEKNIKGIKIIPFDKLKFL